MLLTSEVEFFSHLHLLVLYTNITEEKRIFLSFLFNSFMLYFVNVSSYILHFFKENFYDIKNIVNIF